MRHNPVVTETDWQTPHFNALCQIVDRHGLPIRLRQMVEESHLFLMPGDPAQFLPRTIPEEDLVLFREAFFLPMSPAAIEDDMGVVILRGVGPHQGIIGKWEAFGCIGDDDVRTVFHGFIDVMYVDTSSVGVEITGIDFMGVYSDRGRQAHQMTREAFSAGSNDFGSSAKTALEEVMFLNTPSRFVVQREPLAARKKTKLLARGNERDVYALLTPREIQVIIPEGGSARAAGVEADDEASRHAPRAHPRRAHYRHLTSDRWKNKKGQWVAVPATWIGPTEVSRSGYKWKVRTEL